MADIAGLEPASCGFKSRSPYHFMKRQIVQRTECSATDRVMWVRFPL